MSASNDQPTVAVSQFTTMKRSFDDDLVSYQSAGLRAVEVCEKKMSTDPDEAREQLRRLVQAGFDISSVQPRVHAPFPDEMAEQPEKPDKRLKHFQQTIDIVADVLGDDSNVPLIAITGKAPSHNFAEGWRTAAGWYRNAAEAASQRGLRIAFEALHPTHMNINTFACTLDHARRMLEQVDQPNFGLCFDTYNLWEERDLPYRLRRLADRIFLFHVSDWPDEGPRALHDRRIPGEGHIDLPGLIEAVDEAGYRGPWVMEILSDPSLPDSLWNMEPVPVLERCREGFLRAFQAARDEETSHD